MWVKLLVLVMVPLSMVLSDNGARADDDAKKSDCEQAQKDQDGASTLTISICPAYPYMNHGTYTSYYTVVPSTCNQPSTYDGPNGLSSNCMTGAGCITTFRDKNAATLLHGTHDNLKANGIDPPTEVTPKPGASIQGSDVSIISFSKNPAGAGQAMLAKVFLLELDPAHFSPPRPSEPKVTVAIGYQIRRGTADVLANTLSRDRHQVTIEARVNGQLREFNIILLRGQGN